MQQRWKPLWTFGMSLVVITSILTIIQSVQGFWLFQVWTVNQNIKLWSTYVKQSSVDDVALGTVLAQLGLWNDDYTADPTFENLFRILNVSQWLVEVDILSLVINASNRQSAFQSHLNTIQAIRFETIDVAAWYQAMANKFLDESNACLQRKEAGDRDFFVWVNEQDEILATRGYEDSLEAAPCYITNRVRANAMAYLSTRVQAYAWVLRQRELILTTNQENIITYPELIQSDLPARLLATQRDLARLNAVSFSQVQSTFGWFTTAPVGLLPNYFDVFFPWRRPTYFDPQISLTPEEERRVRGVIQR